MQSQKRAKENKMAKKKKGTGSARRRTALKGFAKGKFQSPVHSDGFKQDMLIDMHGGDRGFATGYGTLNAQKRAQQTLAAGKTFFKHGGTTYRAGTTTGRGGRTTYTAAPHSRPGKVK